MKLNHKCILFIIFLIPNINSFALNNKNVKSLLFVKSGTNFFLKRDNSGKKIQVKLKINHKNKYNYGNTKDEI